MKIVSVAPHIKTFVSANGLESITIPPRVVVSIRDNFVLADSLPDDLRIVEPAIEKATASDKPSTEDSKTDTQKRSK